MRLILSFTCIVCFIPYLSSNVLDLEVFEAQECVISENDVIKANISYHECLKHCKTRASCVAVSYIPKATLCRLNCGVDTPETCEGYYYSRRTSWKNDSSFACRCSPGNQCHQNDGCVPSECDKLADPDHGQMLGTMFSIGDKVTFQCDLGYMLQGNRTRVCTPDGTWSGRNVSCVEVQDCFKYLVSGPDGVEDSQLTASSFWCEDEHRSACTNHWANEGLLDGLSARYARVNSTGYFTGSWSAYSNNINEYIQVDFRTVRIISGIVLQGRWFIWEGWLQFVREFKVLYSLNCADFRTVSSEDGTDKHFLGSIGPHDTVIRYLPRRVKARCVRLNPTAWETHISLRFDVLGC